MKGSTFPADQLTTLAKILEGEKKGAYHCFLRFLSTLPSVKIGTVLFISINPVVKHSTEIQSIYFSDPATNGVVRPPTPELFVPQAVTSIPPVNTATPVPQTPQDVNPQAALLALLAQAANTNSL